LIHFFKRFDWWRFGDSVTVHAARDRTAGHQ